jgi:signal transduction histidine kinase/CheY-like chemotaxis protein/HPt (histidine-containing phosphotransfer) domain-containing protein
MFTALCADLILFNKDRTFFWTMLDLLYGIGALYNGFYRMCGFVLFSEVVLALLFGFRLAAMQAANDNFYRWIVSLLCAFIALALMRVIKEKSKTADKGRSLSRTLLNSTPNLLVLVDDMMRIIQISRSFAKLFRIGNPELAIKRPLSDVLPGNAKLLVHEISKHEAPYETLKEIEIYGQTGYYRIVCENIYGTTRGLYINIIDVTQINMAKIAVERASKAKDLFLAKMSHEIRTPLNAITGMSELILREDVSPRVHEYAHGVLIAGKNLISIVNDILDFSKIESGKMEIIEKNYDVEEMLNDVINIIKMRVLDKPILFTVNIDSAMPRSLIGDAVRIRQIMINILNNAVKYTDGGFVSLKFVSAARSGDKINIRIEVSDSGRGIKQEDFGRVFGEFIRLDMQTNKDVQGTGLGLAITKSLCNAMGGEIAMESEYKKGSTFTVTIPQRISDANALAAVEDAAAKRVLVYEGRELYARSIAESLANLGVPHVIVSNFSMLNETLDNSCTPPDDGAKPELLWKYIFVVSLFYENVSELLQKRKLNIPIIVLAEAGTILQSHVKVIPMPAHTISIARALDGEKTYAKTGDENKKEINWVAPEVKVLVVDDISTNIIVAKGLMAPYKMMITGAQSGQEAIKLISKTRYDLIFMDHMMPEMDGIETVLALKKIPNANGVPIIALTANAVQGAEEMFKQNGFSDLFIKPIEIQRLQQILEKWVPHVKRRESENIISKAAHRVAQATALVNAGSGIPVDLRETIIAANEASTAAGGLPLVIDDINTVAGIKNTGGSANFYKTVLCSYYTEGLEYITKLKNSFEKSDISLWTTYIHGLKSSSANIGAERISRMALTLEEAGKRGDWAYILHSADDFLRQFSILLESIGKFTGENIAEKAAESNDGSAVLAERLDAFIKAAGNLEVSAMEEILDFLEPQVWNKSVTEALEKIRASILISEYEEAASIAEGVKESL